MQAKEGQNRYPGAHSLQPFHCFCLLSILSSSNLFVSAMWHHPSLAPTFCPLPFLLHLPLRLPPLNSSIYYCRQMHPKFLYPDGFLWSRQTFYLIAYYKLNSNVLNRTCRHLPQMFSCSYATILPLFYCCTLSDSNPNHLWVSPFSSTSSRSPWTTASTGPALSPCLHLPYPSSWLSSMPGLIPQTLASRLSHSNSP